MKKTKGTGRKLMAMLLSAVLAVASIPQGMHVYAAEAADMVSEVAETDETDSVKEEVTEENSVKEETEETASDNEAVEEGSFVSEETSTDSLNNEETNANHVSSEAVEEGSSEYGLTEEEVSAEETSAEETSMEETSIEETERVTEEETDEESLKTAARNASRASASGFSKVGGWNESIYAEIAGIKDTDVTQVSYSGAISGELSATDLNYLVRESGSGVRIDIPGLKAGTYTLTVKVGQDSTLTQNAIQVYAYDRSGFAHFNYSDGVGAYKDDGTLKDNAVVLYVTDKNKNDVELTVGNITVKGIGNILNSVGQAPKEGGKPNTNQGIIKALAKAGKPLVVRFVGTVSESGLYKQGTYNAADAGQIDGLTDYDSLDNGGSEGDNGHMARIQSGKHVTLEGIGYDATIDGWGFHYIAEGSDPDLGKSFEVRNLTFINTPEDAIGMEGQQPSKNTSSDISSSVERCWIHNNEFYCPHIDSPAESDKSEGDGSVDFKRGQYFTCSYNYFDSCHKTNLVGSADYSLQFNLTYHHNYWYMCKARGPLTRNANVHMYNNVVDMQTDYAQNTRADAYIFSEYNLFYACKSPQAVEGGAIKSYHDSIASVIWNKGNPGTVVENKSDYVPNACQFQKRGIKYDKFDTDSSQSYIPSNDYQLQTDFADLRKVIVSQTGVQEQNPKLAKDVATSEYSVIVRRNANVKSIDSLPFNDTPGKISKTVYAFEVGAAFDLEVEYASGSKAVNGVLVNEEGENLLTGNGSVVDLPAGKYMIQAETFQPGDSTKGTTADFKDITINSLKLSQHDPDAHYHKWKLDDSKSTAATCTEAGKNVYTCEGTGACDENGTKEEAVSALGHSYEWVIDKPATAEETGLKHQECTRCHDTANLGTEIPAGSSGGGSGDDEIGGGSTAAGDYELYFTGKTPNGDTDFFTISNGKYAEKKGPVTVNDVAYTDCLKIETQTKLSFSCNDDATLFMAFDGASKKVKIDETVYTTDSKGTLTVEDLPGGVHNVTKGDSMNLFYVSVSNGASSEVYYTLSFEYNYDDSPDAKEVQVMNGKSYASMSELAPTSFTRSHYKLKGLYKDASCTEEITYPYTVNRNATFYADWEESDTPVETAYSLIFNSNGGSSVATVKVLQSQIYEIKQKPTRAGYAFAGWYDALEGGNLVDKVDGSTLTGNITVYAHWNALEKVKLSLDCSKLPAGDITEKTNLNNSGFIAHALPEGGGSDKASPKYYMTVKDNVLYTNGVLIEDKSISGNEDGLLKSIEFTTEGSGSLSVEAALSGNPESDGKYELVLVKKSSDGYTEVGRSAITEGKTKTTKEFNISEAGTYYLYAQGNKGVVYYSLKVTEQIYTIIYQPGNGTAPKGLNVGSFTARAGEEIKIPSDCIPATGYIFKGWSADDGITILKHPDVYKVKEEDAVGGTIVIAALYEAKQYTIKYDANGGTLPKGMEATAAASTGDSITLGDCTPAAGYQFVGWSLGRSGEIVKSPYIVNAADADDSATITFKAVYALEGEEIVYYIVTLDTDGGILTDGGGFVRLVIANTAFDPGKCEKVGYVFQGWTVDGKDIELPYKITEDVTFKARYGLGDGSGETPEKPEKRSGIYIVGLEEVYAYTGAKIIPDIGVMDYDIEGGELLEPGVDYTVKYKDNAKPGRATVTVTGKGNYEGKDEQRTFEIKEITTATELADLKGAKLTMIDKELIYTEEAQYPKFMLTLKNAAPVSYTYNKTTGVYEAGETAIAANVALSNNINKGTATILITGANDSKNKPTKVKGTFKITAIDLQENKSKVEVKTEAGAYAVKGAVPKSLTVTYEGKKLRKGTDYTVKYSANKAAGARGKIVITGKGNYTKKYTAEYDIQKLNLNNAKVKAVNAYAGIKAGKVTATITDENGDLLKPAQYTFNIYKDAEGTMKYGASDAINANAVIYVEAVAKDKVNLEGQTSIEPFTVGINIAKAKITLNKGVNGKTITKPYTGNSVELVAEDLTVTIKGDDGKTNTLEMGVDYEIASYTNNINKGTAAAVIKGKGLYSGTKTIKFKITGKSMQIGTSTAWEDIQGKIKSFMKDTY